ncbi:hypothetical protein Ancab_009038 [Ancistrocladus abbreviatus]
MEAEAAATAPSEWAWLPEHLLDSILDIVVSQSEDDLDDPQKRSVIKLGSQYDKRCGGSSHGWLAFTKADISITLLNPFSGATIELPPIGEAPVFEDWEDPFPYCAYYVQKIILSADPSENPQYVVTVIYTDILKVAFKRSTDQVWTHTKLWRINDIAAMIRNRSRQSPLN